MRHMTFSELLLDSSNSKLFHVKRPPCPLAMAIGMLGSRTSFSLLANRKPWLELSQSRTRRVG
jgi:hypothetical protein